MLCSGGTRTINIRDGTDYEEIIEVRRIFQHPLYSYPKLYYDVGIMELERKIEYDYEIFGDSPTCLNTEYDIPELEAIIQGVGLTEKGDHGTLLGMFSN